MRSLIAGLWQFEFVSRLSDKADARITRKQVRIEALRLPDGQMPGTDKARLFNLTLAQSLHAAVILLEREFGHTKEQAIAIAHAAFVQTGSWLVRVGVRIWLCIEREPFAGVKARGLASFASTLWGDGMAVEDRQTQETISLCVLKCPFHEYFQNVQRTDLTPIVCAWDTAWQAEVNASTKPIRVDIPTTLAERGRMCEFTFRQTRLPK